MHEKMPKRTQKITKAYQPRSKKELAQSCSYKAPVEDGRTCFGVYESPRVDERSYVGGLCPMHRCSLVHGT